MCHSSLKRTPWFRNSESGWIHRQTARKHISSSIHRQRLDPQTEVRSIDRPCGNTPLCWIFTIVWVSWTHSESNDKLFAKKTTNKIWGWLRRLSRICNSLNGVPYLSNHSTHSDNIILKSHNNSHLKHSLHYKSMCVKSITFYKVKDTYRRAPEINGTAALSTFSRCQ